MKRRKSSGASRKPRLGALGWSAAMLVGSVPVVAMEAFAQTPSPSQTRPGASAPEASPPSEFSFPPAQGLVAPAGADQVRFALHDIVVDGQFPELEAASSQLMAGLSGREVSVGEVYGFAAGLQQAYLSAGFPLARIVVPPQELGEDGVVHVTVVDGFVEAVDATQLAPNVRSRVASMLEPLIGKRRPTRAMLERRLLLAGDTAGLALSSTLTPGRQTGATVLVLSGEYDPVSAVVAADNRVSEQLGRAQVTASVAFNSPFGHGESLYATYAGYPDGDVLSDDSRRRYLALGASMPVGVEGVMLGLSADYSTTRPGEDVAAQLLEGEYSRVGVWASYPLVRSRAANLVARVAFDAASDVQATKFGGPTTTLSADRVRVLRFGLDGSTRIGDDMGLEYTIGASQGLDVLGARGKGDATPLKPLSRDGADAEFTAIDGSFSLASPSLFGTKTSFSARGRYSFNEPLLRSEQFSPAGWDEMSGPPPGLLVGDSGAVARVEVERQFASADGGEVIAPYAFASATTLRLERPSVLEQASTDATGIGVGLRLGASPRAGGGFGFSGRLEFAHVASDQDDVDRSWVSAAFAVRF